MQGVEFEEEEWANLENGYENNDIEDNAGKSAKVGENDYEFEIRQWKTRMEETLRPKDKANTKKRTEESNYINGYYREIYRSTDPPTPSPSDVPVRDWNNEFQTILGELANCKGNEEEKLGAYNKLSNLAHGRVFIVQMRSSVCPTNKAAVQLDFVFVAKTYGKIIILERCLPVERKTIKPAELGVGYRYNFPNLIFH